MTKTVTYQIAQAGKKDKEFLELTKKHIDGFPIPNMFSTRQEVAFFALLYTGYLLGKHKDDPEKFFDKE